MRTTRHFLTFKKSKLTSNKGNILKVTYLLILIGLIVSGCSNKDIVIQKEYVYLPCKKDSKKKTSRKKDSLLTTLKNKEKIKKEKKRTVRKTKYIAPPKKTKIFAPKRYITKPNKKMDYMVGINKDGSEFVYMEGGFDLDTYKNFKKFLKKSGTTAKEIKINSNGGVVKTAMEIGAFVYENRWKTGVDKEMKCFSACGFVYFAGREKSLQGKGVVGLHRPYIPGVADTTKSIRETRKRYISYWNYIRAPKSVYDEMMLVGRDDLFFLNRNNINDYIDVEIN